MNEEYTVPLALQDFMPVALSSAGLFFLAEMMARATGQSLRTSPELVDIMSRMIGRASCRERV